MEAVLQTCNKSKTVTSKRETIFVPTPGKQSQLWWLWSCVTAQQTLFDNLIYFYTCQPPDQLKKETLAVSATLSRTSDKNEFIFERHDKPSDNKVTVRNAGLVLLFLSKKEYIELLGKLQKDRAANETLLKCQAWLIPPNPPRKIMLQTKDEKDEDEVDEAIRLSFIKSIQPYRKGTIRAVLVRQELGRTTGGAIADELLLVTESPKLQLLPPSNAPVDPKTTVRITCKAFFNANMAAWAVADLLVAEAEENHTPWQLVKLNPKIHKELREQTDNKKYIFEECVKQLRASLTYRTHEFLKVLPNEYEKGSQRLIKAVINEEYTYGKDDVGKREYPVDGYYEILQLYDGNPVDFLNLL